MSITADDVNVLIAAHLRETGAHHTAYIFSNEALVDDTIKLPPQSLITLLQKGMLYMQLEKSINARAKEDETASTIINSIVESAHQQEIIHPPKAVPKQKHPRAPAVPQYKPQQPTIEHPLEVPFVKLDVSDSQQLCEHTGEVFCGSWTQDSSAYATASSDMCAIIWHVKDHKFVNCIKLDHARQGFDGSNAIPDENHKGVFSIAWNHAGTLLSTGSYDGIIRIWSREGKLNFVLSSHTDRINGIQFSPDDKYLLTCSNDNQVIVWNVSDGKKKQVFSHMAIVLDIAWYDETTFASCSGDKTIIICKIGTPKPIRVLDGHQGDVNMIAWDPSKQYLASCSDDFTVRVWKPFEPFTPIELKGHTAQVYTIKWVPGENSPRYLTSGAFDEKIKVWDVPNAQCLYTIDKHENAIYSIAFSPLGKYFISGGRDTYCNIFRTEDSAHIGKLNTSSIVYDLEWSPDGSMIAICQSDNTVAVVQTSQFPGFQE